MLGDAPRELLLIVAGATSRARGRRGHTPRSAAPGSSRGPASKREHNTIRVNSDFFPREKVQRGGGTHAPGGRSRRTNQEYAKSTPPIEVVDGCRVLFRGVGRRRDALLRKTIQARPSVAACGGEGIRQRVAAALLGRVKPRGDASHCIPVIRRPCGTSGRRLIPGCEWSGGALRICDMGVIEQFRRVGQRVWHEIMVCAALPRRAVLVKFLRTSTGHFAKFLRFKSHKISSLRL